MSVEQLVDSLLYEGYALYPYTPGATKNSTPTPHGIVYPQSYAEHTPVAESMLRVEVVAEHPSDTTVSGSVRFLQASGQRHQGAERRVDLEPFSLGRSDEDPPARSFAFAGEREIHGRARMRAEPIAAGISRIRLCVHNESTPEPPPTERSDALLWSLISTHVLVHMDGGRFISPVEDEGPWAEAVAACANLNTWPVLASPDDDTVLGAAMFLPDHPRIAPESLGNLFDNTEIEEALLLHVQTLSEAERAEIAAQDPKVRETIERAERATPEQLLALHGRLEPGHPQAGEPDVTVDGRNLARGARVTLDPRGGGDPYDTILAGRGATIERIYIDYEDGVHIGVTIDDDPGQELMRETGRYLFFRPDEVRPR